MNHTLYLFNHKKTYQFECHSLKTILLNTHLILSQIPTTNIFLGEYLITDVIIISII